MLLPVKAAHGVATTHKGRDSMNTNRDKLVLRRQSIRTLTADELRIAQGGEGGNGTGGGTGNARAQPRSTSSRTPPPHNRLDAGYGAVVVERLSDALIIWTSRAPCAGPRGSATASDGAGADAVPDSLRR